MHRENLETTLRALSQQRPFRPFVVEMVSGSRIQVDHPEALAFRKGVAVYIATDGTPSIFDDEAVAQILARQSRGRGK